MALLIVHGGAGKLSDPDGHRKGVKAALNQGYPVLLKLGALEAVVAVVSALEDDPVFNCGLGSALTIEGTVEADASVMLSDGRCGAVGVVRGVKNPIVLARKVMEETDHILLVGEGAERFARSLGYKTNHNLVTEPRAKLLESLKRSGKAPYLPRFENFLDLGTVGAVAQDEEGLIAVATSTGGLMGKLPGRVGDSAIIGAGTYASEHGGASATGHGEAIARLLITCWATELMERYPAQEAIDRVISEAKLKDCACGIIGIDAQGNLGLGFNTQSMSWGYIKDGNSVIF
jgi:beta-aspartyl-peptidase (threonine type)